MRAQENETKHQEKRPDHVNSPALSGGYMRGQTRIQADVNVRKNTSSVRPRREQGLTRGKVICDSHTSQLTKQNKLNTTC
jgi:hypothetical protein